MAEEVKYNNTLVSGRADETLSYTRYIKDESSGKSTKELLDEKVNKTDQLGTTQIADKAVTTEKLAEHSVDNSKLSQDSVSYDKIQNNAVITEKIQNGAVTTEKVEEKAITNAKLGDQSVDGRVVREASLETKNFANESVTTEKVARKSITKDKLADNAVDASQVVDGSIGNAKLSPDSVTTEKIKDGSVTNKKVADDTLGIEKFDAELRKTIQAATGLPEDLNQMIQDVDQSIKQLHEKDAGLQSQIDDKQQQITANDDDISLLQTRSTQMEEAIKSISASGGASQASAVTYENTESGLDSVTAQGAIDELARKKFNKENIAQEFGDSEDKVVSQFALPFREIDSPEFINAIVDSEDHFLFGIQLDGSIEWGKGIPAPIRAKLEEIITQCRQDKTDLLESINTLNGILDKTTIKDEENNVQDTPFRVIENEEFIHAVADSENRLLFGIYRNSGKPYFPLNEMYHVEQNEEFFAVWLDAANHVLFGIRRDGEIIGEIHAVNTLKQVLSLQENPEYIALEIDAEGKILSATNPDGSHYIHNAKSETIPTEFSHIEDPEGRTEITTDAEDRVLAYRDSEGKKHEHSMETKNLEVSNLNLQGNSVNNIQEALKANGFNVKTPIDWSENSKIQIPEPRLAFVNITNISYMPTSKGQNMHAIFEFWDMQGNYFKKKVILDAQGNSSLGMPKKNFACDFCNDDWLGDDTFEIKFGNWVPQDSFHFKAFYADFFKGVSMVGYKLFDEIESTRSSSTNRIWKRALLPSADVIGYGTKGMESFTDMKLLIDNGARCYPDGFPCVVHLNGSFYGVFSWALKKHRDNYMQNKSKPENIQLDGDIYDTFMYNGNIDWDVVNGTKASSEGGTDGFEFRNPKSLICIDGTKYDADNNRKELIDSNSEHYDASNKNHVNTNKVKGYYKTLTTYIPTLKEMEEQGEETSAIRNKIQSFFDIDSLIDYLIFSDVTANFDGFRKNWQWLTYNGIKWAVSPYDLDGTLGWSGWGEESPTLGRYGNTLDLPTGWIIKYFDTELCERYKTLRADILTAKNIFSLLNEWCSRIGASNFEKDLLKWPQTSELYPPFGTNHYDNIYRVENWLIARLKKCDEIYKFN
nr:MAG TPA: CotH kinase protein [Caudoviricetes sp.]